MLRQKKQQHLLIHQDEIQPYIRIRLNLKWLKKATNETEISKCKKPTCSFNASLMVLETLKSFKMSILTTFIVDLNLQIFYMEISRSPTQNCRITASYNPLCWIPCYEHRYLSLGHIAQNPSNLILKTMNDGVSTPSLVYLFQWLITLTIKNIFLMPNLILLLLSWKLLAHHSCHLL